MRTGLVWLGLGVGLAAAAAVALQAAAEARDRRRFPPPGRLLDVGGHRLHALIAGDRGVAPAIVFESGLSGDHRTWELVRERIGPRLMTVAYDRAGSGWSDPGPRPRTVEVMARELRRMLQEARIAPPYLLVGHSYGTMVSRMYAALHPSEVSGLVLVDPSHENQRMLWRGNRAERVTNWMTLTGLRIRPLLARAGWFRWRRQPRRDRSGDAVETMLASRSRAWDWVWGEALAIPASEEQVRRAPALPHVPLVVLRSHAPRQDRLWIRLGRAIADSVPDGRVVVVEGAGHAIQVERPDLVSSAIQDVVTRATGG